MNTPLDFQSIMMTLQQFWAKQGCLIWQPYYTQVGAGTMNPATYLRVLGPEPWNVGYVEPSVRPDDGRYGENPNRLQQHYQFQVILKPDPGNPQELYLKSLEALGIDPRQHDIRFVEDNWESPALGAWGLGWEVWLDGQEITQFTYFQQAGGMVVDPVAVEITYGLERIAMPLQRVRNFRDIHWNQQRTYGDVNLQAEQEHSKYYFEVADVEKLRQQYNLFEDEANAALANNLVLPAHDYILKCSHTFNILDTRGAVGVTERQALFSRMRDLARRVAEAYVAQRESLGFPMKKETDQTAPVEPQKVDYSGMTFSDNADFLLEIGTEELPAADMQSALNQLQERMPALLEELRLAHSEVKVLGTPRRLVIWVSGLSSRQPDRTNVVKGPPASRAYDASGVATPAAVGFARSRGMDVKDLQVSEIDGGQYVTALSSEKGRSAPEVLAEAIPGLIAGLKFEKIMRWNSSNVAFSRPIRWLLALFGETVVPFNYAGYSSGRKTRGLRFRTPEEFEISNPAEYFEELGKQSIILDPVARREVIASQVVKLMKEVGGLAKLDDGLLDEVNQLVESPTALRGQFGGSHLELPAVVLVSVMKKHQRYFPVYATEEKLLPYFIAVRNGDDYALDTVIDGNEQVIGARFADAAFFIKEDLKHKLEDFLPRLSTLTFQFKLGSMLDRSKRITNLVKHLAPDFLLSEDEAAIALRASQLCKADLVTHMVVEMTSVQGAIGRFYALKSGETLAVSKAIFEHYLPRYSGDENPASLPGFLVGVADRMDALSGLFAAGLAPSGTKDPFALRRAALGLVQTLIKRELDFDIQHGLAVAEKGLPFQVDPKTQADCLEFIVGRLRSTLIEQGFKYDVVDAVLTEQSHNPSGAYQAILRLTDWIARPDWASILPAYSRCVRITRDHKQDYAINPDFLEEAVEKELYQSLLATDGLPHREGSVEDFFRSFMPCIPVITRFFDEVLVMAEDPIQRANRLGLLQWVARMTKGIADFSKLEGF